MSPEQFAGAIGAFGTFIIGLYGAYRLAKADKYKASSDQAALLLTGWRDLQQSIAQEVDRVKKSCAEQIEAMKHEHEEDRLEWQAERELLKAEIETLKAQVYALMELQKRPPQARTRRTDRTKDK